MEPTQRRITDAADLKALAHPLRMDLLERLIGEGPQTATRLAEALGQSPSNCSWHLRKLAEHGFVEEAPGGSGRNRPWQAASRGLTWGESAEDPESSAAGRALTDVLIGRELEKLRQAREAEQDEPPEWRDVTEVYQSGLWLTPEEARELSAGLRDLLHAHIERTFDPALRPAGSRPISLMAWLAVRPDQPLDPARTPRPQDPTGETS